MSTKRGAEPLQAVDRAVRLLTHLAADPSGELGVSDIARGMNLPKATVYRLLATLLEHRFVEQAPDSGKYRLSWGVFEVGNRVPGVIKLKSTARPEMAALCETSHETVNLGVRDGADVVLIDKVDANQLLRLELEIGRREPLHATALGRALLLDHDRASLVGQFGREPLAALTPQTPTSLDRLERILAVAKKVGFATDDEEFAPNIRCVGAPIRNHYGQIVAAISISGPASRFTQERAAEVTPCVVQAAGSISRLLGHRPSRWEGLQ